VLFSPILTLNEELLSNFHLVILTGILSAFIFIVNNEQWVRSYWYTLLYKINNNENKHNSRYYLFYNFEIIFNIYMFKVFYLLIYNIRWWTTWVQTQIVLSILWIVFMNSGVYHSKWQYVCSFCINRYVNKLDNGTVIEPCEKPVEFLVLSGFWKRLL